MTVEERRRRRFSESFRREQVDLIESGKTTIQEVSLRYQVKPFNVRRWVKRYGKKSLPKPILITNASEINRMKELEKENRKLYELLGKQQAELVYQKSLVKLAKDRLGEDFEKK